MSEFPYVLRNRKYLRHGQACKQLSTPGYYGEKVQIQFEDGETMVVDRFNLAGAKKKYTNKVGRPRKIGGTLPASPSSDRGDLS